MMSNNFILISKYVSVLYKSFYFIKYHFMLKMRSSDQQRLVPGMGGGGSGHAQKLK